MQDLFLQLALEREGPRTSENCIHVKELSKRNSKYSTHLKHRNYKILSSCNTMD